VHADWRDTMSGRPEAQRISSRRNSRGAAALTLAVGLALVTLPAAAQVRSQAPAPSGLRVQNGQPATQPTGGVPFRPGHAPRTGSGVSLFPNQFNPGLPQTVTTPQPITGGPRANFPGPIRPGQGRLRLPPTPP